MTKIINSIVIVGGTHGNELTGVYLAKKHGWLLANPKAAELCCRYIDRDLNRCFAMSELSSGLPSAALPRTTNGLLANNSKNSIPYELLRAKEINEILGKKGSPTAPDLILDIHNTTANMGITLILSARDEFLQKIAFTIAGEFKNVNIYMQPEEREKSPYLGTIAKRDICIEAGPQSHGTLDAKLFFEVEKVVLRIAELATAWLQSSPAQRKIHNCDLPEIITPFNSGTEVFTEIGNVDYPRDENGNITAMIHPDLQGKDFCELRAGMPAFLTFDGNTIPWEGETCYPAFINEHAYYEKGIAMSLTKREFCA